MGKTKKLLTALLLSGSMAFAVDFKEDLGMDTNNFSPVMLNKVDAAFDGLSGLGKDELKGFLKSDLNTQLNDFVAKFENESIKLDKAINDDIALKMSYTLLIPNKVSAYKNILLLAAEADKVVPKPGVPNPDPEVPKPEVPKPASGGEYKFTDVTGYDPTNFVADLIDSIEKINALIPNNHPHKKDFTSAKNNLSVKAEDEDAKLLINYIENYAVYVSGLIEDKQKLTNLTASLAATNAKHLDSLTKLRLVMNKAGVKGLGFGSGSGGGDITKYVINQADFKKVFDGANGMPGRGLAKDQIKKFLPGKVFSVSNGKVAVTKDVKTEFDKIVGAVASKDFDAAAKIYKEAFGK